MLTFGIFDSGGQFARTHIAHLTLFWNAETVFMHPELLVLSKQREDYTALEQELLKSFSHTEVSSVFVVCVNWLPSSSP